MMGRPISRAGGAHVPDVTVVEVAPRDGLQNDDADADDGRRRSSSCGRLVAAGVTRVEVASFVNPARVPQMADAEEVVAGLPRRHGRPRAVIGLVLNERGFERAVGHRRSTRSTWSSGHRHLQPAQPGHDHGEAAVRDRRRGRRRSRRGGRPVADGHARRRVRLPVRGRGRRRSASSARRRGCAAGRRRDRARRHDRRRRPGRRPRAASSAVRAVHRRVRLRAHFHNTRNTGYANALAGVEAGVDVLDASCGGIGGCPFAPSATGNIATEDLVYLLERSGITTGLDLDALVAASDWLGDQLGRPDSGSGE